MTSRKCLAENVWQKLVKSKKRVQMWLTTYLVPKHTVEHSVSQIIFFDMSLVLRPPRQIHHESSRKTKKAYIRWWITTNYNWQNVKRRIFKDVFSCNQIARFIQSPPTISTMFGVNLLSCFGTPLNDAFVQLFLSKTWTVMFLSLYNDRLSRVIGFADLLCWYQHVFLFRSRIQNLLLRWVSGTLWGKRLYCMFTEHSKGMNVFINC